jgi:outer membrane protein
MPPWLRPRPRIAAGYTIEKHLQEARVGELNRVRLDVGLEAATAYIEVLRAQTRLEIQRENLAFSRTNLERAQVRVTVGEANRSELYRWQSKIAAEQAQVMAAAVNRRLAAIELNRALYRPLEAPFELVDTTLGDQYLTLIDPRIDRYTRDPRSLDILRDFLVQKGLVGSPELQQFDASILAAERAHTAATRSFWLPDIGLAGSVGHVFSRGGEGSPITDPNAPDDTSWNVGVFLSLPLLEGGARFAETRRATQETYRLTRGREATAQRVEQNVRDAIFLVASSRLAIDLARKAADAARLNLELVADNYTMGLVSLVDLLDAQTTAFNSDLAAPGKPILGIVQHAIRVANSRSAMRTCDRHRYHYRHRPGSRTPCLFPRTGGHELRTARLRLFQRQCLFRHVAAH